MENTYRTGAVGALMDEYERAAVEFRSRFECLTQDQYNMVVDPQAKDANCRSVQTIMSHVVAAGYNYANYIRDAFSIAKNSPPGRQLAHGEWLTEFDSMLDYTVATLSDKWDLSENQMSAVSMRVSWGPTYDLEQLLEHAIVHILRHRRQLDKWGLVENNAEARTN